MRKTLMDMYCDAHAELTHLAQALDMYDVNIDQALIELEDCYPIIDECAEIEFNVPYEEEKNVKLWEVE